MKRMRWWKVKSPHPLGWFVLLGILLFAPAIWSLDIPPLTGRVVDRAQVLSSSDHSRLNDLLAAHESRTSNQVAVLILPSLAGEPLEEFSHRVASAWGLGYKGTDNGVLLLVALQERKIRIEVGYGLEGTLTDAKSSRIIRNEMVPRFRQEEYSKGIMAGVQAILQTIEGTYTPSPPTNEKQAGFWAIFFQAVFLGTIVALFLGGRRVWSGALIGSILSFFIALPVALWLGLLAGVVTTLLVSLFTKGGSPLVRGPLTGGSHPGWGGGLWPPGGRIRSSGGFGGGFGGSGGGFGGGGASGRW
jgi:uncharacterized protein